VVGSAAVLDSAGVAGSAGVIASGAVVGSASIVASGGVIGSAGVVVSGAIVSRMSTTGRPTRPVAPATAIFGAPLHLCLLRVDCASLRRYAAERRCDRRTADTWSRKLLSALFRLPVVNVGSVAELLG
jgi:carbonic anhydrase/acetyltransferase-like protein (isoleucine patch superfamily)